MDSACTLCPRSCLAFRSSTCGSGVCRTGTHPVVARAAKHMWEEPCISGDCGSGAVFFSGCSLGCVYCQNRIISLEGFGKTISPDRLREIFSELISQNVHNINLVNPTHFASAVIEALAEPLPVPVIWNSGGYDTVNTLRMLEGKVQIYLPDLKYMLPSPAVRYSNAPDYPKTATDAILEMFRQTGAYVTDDGGLLKSGVLIRHLVLPGNLENTYRVIDWVDEHFGPGDVLFSLMSQFTPTTACADYPEINRTLSQEEHESAVSYLSASGISDGFFQELSSASPDFLPDFDLTGI